MSEAAPNRKKRIKWGCIVPAVLLLIPAFLWGPAAWDLREQLGALVASSLSKGSSKEYEATSEQNLKALHTAMMLYHDSEGQFPDGAGWMDAISNRIRTEDLAKGEEQKKLIHPSNLGQAGKYGYAMNDAASQKYKDDVKDPGKTPLLFESTVTNRNAHGDPEKIRSRSGLAITIDGTILRP